MKRFASTALSILAICGACKQSDATRSSARTNSANSARVDGEVYLSRRGDLTNAPGPRIYLVSNTAALQSTIRTYCDTINATTLGTVQQIRLITDSLAEIPNMAETLRRRIDEAVAVADRKRGALRDSIDLAMIGSSRDTSGTGTKAHYALRGIRPGSYWLFGALSIGEKRYRWLSPIAVAAGDSMANDLVGAEVSDKSYCSR